jgi:hypothetical protein
MQSTLHAEKYIAYWLTIVADGKTPWKRALH